MNLTDIFVKGDRWYESKLTCTKMSDGYEIMWTQMYDPPEINFGKLKELSDFFGTINIDVDNYSQSGCETCDYGSEYGHSIQIREVTKNEELLKQAIGEIYNEK